MMNIKRLTYYLAFLLLGTFILSPLINFQRTLSHGDHGLALYAMEAVFRGEIPYYDFHWFYGPLSLYYYAFFFKILGVSVLSVLIGNFVLKIIAGLFVLNTLKQFTSSAFAFAGGLLFLTFNFEPFYTYNHNIGITLTIGIFFFFSRFIKDSITSPLYCALIFIVLLSLNKFNMGLAVLTAFFISVCFSAYFKKVLSTPEVLNVLRFTVIITPLFIIGIHVLFLSNLPFDHIKQCFTYFGNDSFNEQGYPTLTENLSLIWFSISHFANSSKINTLFLLLILLCLVSLIIQKNVTNEEKLIKIKSLLLIGSTLVFYVFLIHEFLISGVAFRSLWGETIFLLLILLLLSLGTEKHSKMIRILLVIIIFAMTTRNYLVNFNYTKEYKIPENYINHPKIKIYTGNGFDWNATVFGTINYMEKQLKTNERFLVFPYGAIYYYLLDRTSPVREQQYYKTTPVTQEQEMRLINEMEKQNINWVIMTSQIYPDQEHLGQFGRDNTPVLFHYLKNNFKLARQFGDWRNKGSWLSPHGIKILRRK